MKQICILLAFSGIAFSQSPTPPKPASIEGTIRNSVTHEPIRKVALTLGTTEMDNFAASARAMLGGADSAPNKDKPGAPPSPAAKSFSATTDANGTFRFEGVDPGDYLLRAKRTGYSDGIYRPTVKSKIGGQLHVLSGDALTGVDLSLVPFASVSGRVVDEDDDPVPGAMISAVTAVYSGSRRRLTMADTAIANGKGEFALDKLPPGRYYLSANVGAMDLMSASPTPAPTNGEPETGYVTTYFPGAVDTEVATKVDVASGTDTPGFVIHMKKALVARVKGQAFDAEGKPVTAGQVMLMNPGSGSFSMRMSAVRPDGRFEIAGVQPGQYTLMTVEMKGASPSIQIHAIVVPKEGLKDVKLASVPEGTVRGTVVVAGGEKIALGKLSIMLRPADEVALVMPAMVKVVNNAFSVKVAAAQYQLMLSQIPRGAYLKSVLFNGRETLGKPLDFSSGPSGELVVTLGTDGGEVAVTVSNRASTPAGASTVVLLAADPTLRLEDLTKSEDADDTGHATFVDVPPGDYLAIAWKDVDQGAWYDPDFVKRYEKDAKRIVVSPKGKQEVELKEAPEGR